MKVFPDKHGKLKDMFSLDHKGTTKGYHLSKPHTLKECRFIALEGPGSSRSPWRSIINFTSTTQISKCSNIL